MLEFDESDFHNDEPEHLIDKLEALESDLKDEVTGDNVPLDDIESVYNVGVDVGVGDYGAEVTVNTETGEILQTKITEPQTNFLGFHDIEMSVYRNADGLANSELQIFDKNPSGYVWCKTSPSDPTKADASDFGTALHCALLEPDMYDDLVIFASTKGRTSQAFIDMQVSNKGNVVLTDTEDKQIELMRESANCHPMFKRILDASGAYEGSIFVDDPRTGLRLKIRPDKIIDACNPPIFTDIKSTKDLDDWRSDTLWKNPLFDMGYGFTAAYYLYVGSIHYGVEMKTYNFGVVSKSASLGKYPVSVFTITKEQLIEYGFWSQMTEALDRFAECKEKNKWVSYEQFPEFRLFNDETISFVE